MNFYERYAAIRDEKGLSDYKVAKLSGVAPSTISGWKTEGDEPKLETASRIANALGVPLDDLAPAPT